MGIISIKHELASTIIFEHKIEEFASKIPRKVKYFSNCIKAHYFFLSILYVLYVITTSKSRSVFYSQKTILSFIIIRCVTGYMTLRF